MGRHCDENTAPSCMSSDIPLAPPSLTHFLGRIYRPSTTRRAGYTYRVLYLYCVIEYTYLNLNFALPESRRIFAVRPRAREVYCAGPHIPVPQVLSEPSVVHAVHPYVWAAYCVRWTATLDPFIKGYMIQEKRLESSFLLSLYLLFI